VHEPDDATILTVERRGDVAVLRWTDGENRFNRPSVARWNAVLDELEADDGPLAVVCVGEGRIFSNGLDLDWISTAGGEATGFIDDLHALLGRFMTFPAYTVAAINGHAFAAGAMLSMGFDARVMRADRGWWCLPEVDLGLPLTDAMLSTVAAKLPKATLHDAAVTGRRYTAAQALAAGIVEEVADEADVLERAVQRAAANAGKDRSVIGTHKRMLYADVVAACTAD